MFRTLLLVLALLTVAACGTTRPRAVDESPLLSRSSHLEAAEEGGGSRRTFLDVISDRFTDHWRDSMAGMSFSARALSRNFSRDWARTQGVGR